MNLNEQIRAAAEEKLRIISEHKEEIVTAWMAKTGIAPEKATLLVQQLPGGAQKISVVQKDFDYEEYVILKKVGDAAEEHRWAMVHRLLSERRALFTSRVLEGKQ